MHESKRTTFKIVAGWFLIITAILFPLAWPVLIAWIVWECHKRRQRQAQAKTYVSSQPVRLPGQMGAL